ncbi:MAG: formylglycine-generating enzyme family protein [Akkermansiaceae bacterium]|nr:formylglycine-generating enzyme family protein [Akkermansiaceae bacterium]
MSAAKTKDAPTRGWLEAAGRAVPEHGGLTIWLDAERTVPMFFRRLPAGEFRMGSRGEYGDEEPIHRVRIARDFYIGFFPVTQRQFAVFRPDHVNGFPERPWNPAEQVTWDDARGFAGWLNKSGRLPAGLEARLPCEAEWEYACRAGTTSEYHSGNGEAALRRVGWFKGNAGGSTHPVGELDPNAWGLYDLHGNVEEWCEDAWDAAAYRKRGDGWVARAWETADESPHRAIRGGSWSNPAWICRSAYRDWGRPGIRLRILGFRLVLAPVSGVGDPARQAKGGAAAGSGAGSDGTERKAEDGAAAPAENFFEKSRLPRLPGGDGN